MPDQSEHRKIHWEIICDNQRDYRANNQEKIHDYHLDYNQEELHVYISDYYAKHLEEIRARYAEERWAERRSPHIATLSEEAALTHMIMDYQAMVIEVTLVINQCGNIF